MSFLPKIERITRDLTFSHFLLMFGYKLFSLYFPLFLLARGLSFPEIGYTYLLIYLPIALFAIPASYLNHKVNPAILTSFGILGYGLYSLGMIKIQSPFLFYFWQTILGISAVLFFVSSRAILMGSSLEQPDRSFAWFYSAPFYAEALAPAVGAFFIWQFGFTGVFILSLFIHLLNFLFCFFKLQDQAQSLVNLDFHLRDFRRNYQEVFLKLKEKKIFSLIFVSLSVLFLAGFYRAFFVVFLRQELNWTQNLVLIYGTTFSFSFSLLSLFLIKKIGQRKSYQNIIAGGTIVGFFTALFGLLAPVLNFLTVFLMDLGKSAGSLIVNSGRSGLVNRKLKQFPKEAGGIDTIFAPLGVALGSAVSGFLIPFLGFNFLFLFGGIFVLVISLVVAKIYFY